jgi:LuxR family transcriptional regulator, maltose regulon positive regulatory protein
VTHRGMSSSGRGQAGFGPGRDAGPHGAAAARGGLILQPLLSNLQLPRPRVDMVARRGLVAGLLRSTTPLVVVSAPAGSGKTLSLVQWAQADRRPAAWLQLDTADNDAVVLLTYLGLALEGVTVVDPGVFDHLTASITPIRTLILPALEASLSAAEPFLLVLDDAHLVRAKTCWEILRFVIEHLPPGAQLALATREDPPLPLGRMRASGLVAEVRAPELALSRHEAGELLELHGRTLDEGALDTLLKATEGWAAGVYLALLAGERRPVGRWLPEIHGDEHAIADYLMGEVLERQPYGTQEFLLKTSILERFSAPLCQAVTGRSDARAALRRLARENLFVVALDEREEWYRYHHLFAELLRTELERRMPGEVAALHRAAAAWCDERGDAEQAIRHWLAAGDVRPAAELVARWCTGLIDLGQTGTAKRLLGMFSDRQILSHLPLTVAAGWVYGLGHPHYTNELTRRHLVRTALTADVGDLPPYDLHPSLRASQVQLRTFLAPDGIARMLADADLSVELESAAPNQPNNLEARKLRGMALYFAGRLDAAVKPLRAEEDGTQFSGEASAVPPPLRSLIAGDRGTWGKYDQLDERTWAGAGLAGAGLWPPTALDACEVLAYQSLIAGDQGRWDEAEELDRRAWERFALVGAEVEPPLAVLLCRARVLARREAPDLDDHLQRVSLWLREMPNVFEREAILGAVVLGEISLGRGELDGAAIWSDRAQAVLRTYPDAGMLRPRAERLRLAVQERSLGLAVTAAEQRVLDLLPTELSAQEIGVRLFVSHNTMRSHLRSLYAKLGVHSRRAAVERARALGLLKPEH